MVLGKYHQTPDGEAYIGLRARGGLQRKPAKTRNQKRTGRNQAKEKTRKVSLPARGAADQAKTREKSIRKQNKNRRRPNKLIEIN